MPDLSCHSGAVRIEVDEAPETVTSCNCSFCRRTGALMAYYPPAKVRFTPSPPPTDTYLWGDKSIVHHRCRICGCLTHWSAVDPGYDRMGVNMRLADPEVLAKVRIRRFDGAEIWTFLKP
ncbi:MAG: GFA family protein [Parvularculaceae bacterium]|nr:GFA family protein [Parvularculaceae bacterium]